MDGFTACQRAPPCRCSRISQQATGTAPFYLVASAVLKWPVSATVEVPGAANCEQDAALPVAGLTAAAVRHRARKP